jgi:ubiquinone/menaquinone biosynthesis C-methylase UbiE
MAMNATAPAPIQTYKDLASTYDEVRFTGAANRVKEGFRERALLQLLPASAGDVLDVACGTGRGLRLLARRARTTIGIDGTLEMLQHASRKLRGDGQSAYLCRANAASLPFPDGAFDAVTCLNFFHLFENVALKQQFLSEVARVLRPGGTAVVEFDNAMHGLVIGPARKYFGKDIGYEWPWHLRRYFGDRLQISRVAGTNIPFVWRIRPLHFLERLTGGFPVNYLASRLLVQAIRR